MTTTAIVYPEVRAELERPDRIRREAFKLLEKGQLFKLSGRSRLVFTVEREENGHIELMKIDVDPIPEWKPGASVALAETREEIYRKLVELLESE